MKKKDKRYKKNAKNILLYILEQHHTVQFIIKQFWMNRETGKKSIKVVPTGYVSSAKITLVDWLTLTEIWIKTLQ